MPEDELYRRFSGEFEEKKKTWVVDEDDDADDSPCLITIQAYRGWQDLPGSEANVVVEIPTAIMNQIFRSWTDKVEQLVNKYFEAEEQEDCLIVMVTGASRLNDFLRLRLATCVNNLTVTRRLCVSKSDSPITFGGLRQYPHHKPASLPPDHWYLVHDQRFDSRIHSDAKDDVWEPREEVSKTGQKYIRRCKIARPSWSTSKIKQNELDGKPEAVDRLQPFMSKLPGQPPQTFCVAMEFIIDANCSARIRLDIYHSTERHLKHKPLRNADGSIKSCFKQWPLILVDLPDPSQGGCDKTESPDDTYEYRLFHEQTQELWDAHRSHTIADGISPSPATEPLKTTSAAKAVAPKSGSSKKSTACRADSSAGSSCSLPKPGYCMPAHWNDDRDDEEISPLPAAPNNDGSGRVNGGWQPINNATDGTATHEQIFPTRQALDIANGSMSHHGHEASPHYPQLTGIGHEETGRTQAQGSAIARTPAPSLFSRRGPESTSMQTAQDLRTLLLSVADNERPGRRAKRRCQD